MQLMAAFTLAHLSDPHLPPLPVPRLADLAGKRALGYLNWIRNRRKFHRRDVLDALVSDLQARGPDHIAITGDLVNLALEAEFAPALKWLESVGAPDRVTVVPGNHDAYVRASMPMLKATFEPWTTGDSGVSGFPYLRVRGEVAIIGLSSGVPTAPLMATGRVGRKQLQAFAALLDETGAQRLARVVLIHHPPLTRGEPPFRGLTDAAAFERVVGEHGAEAILHGHTHKQHVRSLPSRAARTISGTVPVLGAPAASAATHDPRTSAAYHLVRLELEQGLWRVTARVRGLALGGEDIGEREALAV
jgi:3',5'-cyclic AMP phosphodiesterase CpdA